MDHMISSCKDILFLEHCSLRFPTALPIFQSCLVKGAAQCLLDDGGAGQWGRRLGSHAPRLIVNMKTVHIYTIHSSDNLRIIIDGM